MNDKAKWRVARLDEIERRGSFIPVREHLGIHSFGINARTVGEDGTLINEHDEAAGGQEEVYVILDGTATFEVDGQTFEAPPGTFVSVQPGVKRKATGDATVLIIGGTPGQPYQALDWGEARPMHDESMTAYTEQRYADAAAAVRDLEGVPGADIGFVHTTEPLARGRPAAEPRPTPLCARRSAAARDCWRGLHSAGRDQRQPEGLAGFQLRPINDNSDPRRLGVRGPRATLQAQAFRNL